MSDDSIRYNLVMQCACARCGNLLRLSYDRKRPDRPEHKEAHYRGDVTGAAKVEAVLSVHPCETCYEKAAAPSRHLAQAIKMAGDL